MIETFFNLQIIAAAWPILCQGLLSTIGLSLLVIPLGFVGGLVLAVLSTVRNPWVRWPLMAWVDFFRAFPPLVLLIFLYAALPSCEQASKACRRARSKPRAAPV